VLLASATWLAQALPAAEIKECALVRPLTGGEISNIREPVNEIIQLLADGQTRRVP
jgi:hypothetical protein